MSLVKLSQEVFCLVKFSKYLPNTQKKRGKGEQRVILVTGGPSWDELRKPGPRSSQPWLVCRREVWEDGAA